MAIFRVARDNSDRLTKFRKFCNFWPIFVDQNPRPWAAFGQKWGFWGPKTTSLIGVKLLCGGFGVFGQTTPVARKVDFEKVNFFTHVAADNNFHFEIWLSRQISGNTASQTGRFSAQRGCTLFQILPKFEKCTASVT